MPKLIKEYQTIDIIAKIGPFCNNEKYNINFIVDGEEKKVQIITEKESNIKVHEWRSAELWVICFNYDRHSILLKKII